MPVPATIVDAASRFFAERLVPRDAATASARPLVGAALRGHVDEAAQLSEIRAFQADLYDAGLAWLEGPPELGGAGLDAATVCEVRRVAQSYEFPDTNALLVGLQIIAPALMQFGDAVQRSRFLPALYRGDLVGCQLFSEPDAGSDLASLRTRAVAVDGGWRVTGQKVWSSGAHTSDIGELLARTDEDASMRHRGLSMFLVDMRSPGITVVPLRQMTGSAHFCEAYLDDVFVPSDRLLGPLGGGWAVAQVSLSSERDGFGAGDSAQLFVELCERLIAAAREAGRSRDPLVRQHLAGSWIDDWLTRRLPEWLATRGGAVGAVAPSLVKLHCTRADWTVAQRAAMVLGPAAVAIDGDWATVVLGVAAPRIAGGTDEIQRNIVGERGLGLPREPRGSP